MPLQKDFKYSWSERVFDPNITVRCRKISAELDKQKFGSGSRGKCIMYKDEWITPSEFEVKCGLVGSRDWKRSIHCEGRRLQCLIEDAILRPHSKACLCSLCCNDESSDEPVRYFMRPKRKIQTPQPAFKKPRHEMNSDNVDSVTSSLTCKKKLTYNDENHLPMKQSSVDLFSECLDGVLSKIDELRNIVKDLKEEFCRELSDSRRDIEIEKQKEIDAIQIKAKMMVDKRISEEKQLMDIKLQEALAQIRQELTEKFSKSK